MTDPVFLEAADVLTLHDEAVRRFGGLPGVRDEGLLLSALVRAENKYAYAEADTPDLWSLAAAYAFGIAKNHPFNDGNKRTAWGACLAFLRLNGTSMPEMAETAVEMMVRLAAGEVDEAGFAAWLRSLPG